MLDIYINPMQFEYDDPSELPPPLCQPPIPKPRMTCCARIPKPETVLSISKPTVMNPPSFGDIKPQKYTTLWELSSTEGNAINDYYVQGICEPSASLFASGHGLETSVENILGMHN